MANNETPTRQRAGRIKDVRGRSINLLDPVAMYLLRPVTELLLNHPNAIPATTLRNIAEALDAKWTSRAYRSLTHWSNNGPHDCISPNPASLAWSD